MVFLVVSECISQLKSQEQGAFLLPESVLDSHREYQQDKGDL
jgi:hypothetical protein